MNAKEMYNEMKTIPFEPQGKLPENLEYLQCSNEIVEITEEQQQELTKILAKFDAHGGKLDKLSKDWRNKQLPQPDCHFFDEEHNKWIWAYSKKLIDSFIGTDISSCDCFIGFFKWRGSKKI